MFKITKSLAIIAIAIVAVAGATYAWFSDTATVTGSTVSVGTLDLQVDSNVDPSVQAWSDGFASPIALTNVKPGDSFKQIVDIKNVGSIDGINATIKFIRKSTADQLRNNLRIDVSYKGENDPNFIHITGGTLAQFEGNTYTLGDLDATKVGNVKIEWSIPGTAGNDIQGDSVVIDTVFGLEQEQI